MSERDKELLYWRLTPIYQRAGGMATACMVNCLATGEVLSGHGGPAYALSPDIVKALDMKKSGPSPRMVVDTELFEELVETLKCARVSLSRALLDLGEHLCSSGTLDRIDTTLGRVE